MIGSRLYGTFVPGKRNPRKALRDEVVEDPRRRDPSCPGRIMALIEDVEDEPEINLRDDQP